MLTYPYMYNILKDFIYTQCPLIPAERALICQENKSIFRVQWWNFRVLAESIPVSFSPYCSGYHKQDGNTECRESGRVWVLSSEVVTGFQ